MLSNLTARLNKDENMIHEREIFTECSVNSSNDTIIDKINKDNYNIEDLKLRLLNVQLSDCDSVETNVQKLVDAAKANETIIESVVSTNKSISITEKDHEELLSNIKVIQNNDSDESDKKEAKKRIKSFLKVCNKQIAKCNDDNPADAFIISIINKLCRVLDCKIDINKDEKLTRKAELIIKINAIAKNI